MANTIQSKRRRRLTILIVVILFMIGGVVGLLFFRNWQQGQRLTNNRQAGLAAYEAGDYATAVERLQPVAGSGKARPQTLVKYATARLKTPMKDNAQVGHALRALKDAFSAEPANLEIGHRLLNLLSAYNAHSQALDAANTVLEHHPDDLKASRIKARSLLGLTRLDEARAAARNVIQTHPKDIQARMMLLRIGRQLDTQPSALLDRAKDWQSQFPDDPRFNLPLAFAYELAGDHQQGLNHLASAAEAKAIGQEPGYAKLVLRYLDVFNRYRASLALLQRAARLDETADESDKPPAIDDELTSLQHELVRRLFETGRYEQVVSTVGKFAKPKISAAMVGLKALALWELDQANQAEQALQRLRKMDQAGPGQAWAEILQAMHGQGNNGQAQSAEQIVKTIESKIDQAGSSAYLHYFAGQALAQLDRFDEASAHWRQAMKRRPTWAAPRTRLARLALTRDEPQEAMRLSQQSLVRNQGNLNAAVTYVMASASGADTGDREQLQRLLRQAQALQKASPGEPYSQLLTVALHAQLGNKEKARSIGGKLLNRQPVLSQQQLVRLANISRRYDLGLQDRAYALVSQNYGSTPSLTLVKALEQAQSGNPEQGLQQLEQAIQAAKADKDQWRLAKAQFLDRTNPKQARQYWKKLAEQMSDNRDIQRQVLKKNWITSQRPFMRRTLDRLRSISGRNDPTWRLYQAQYLLSESPMQANSSTDGGTQTPRQNNNAPTQQQALQFVRETARKAKTLLQPVLDDGSDPLRAHMLLASAEQRLGNRQAALQHLTAVVEASPDNPRIAIRQAQLELSLGQRQDAQRTLNRVTRADAKLSPSQQVAAATIYAQLDQTDHAISMLEALHDQDQLPGNGLRQLARLYTRANQPQKALALREEMLDQPSASDVLLIAAILRRQDRPGDADQVLDRLETMDISEANRQTLLGSHYLQFNQPDRALEHLRAAAEQAPADTDNWRRLVSVLLSQGRSEDALAAAKQGLNQSGQSPGLQALVERQSMVVASGDQPIYQPLLVGLVRDQASRNVIAQAMDRISRAGRQQQSTGELAQSIGELARDHRDIKLLQVLAARLYLRAGQSSDAADLAKQAMQRFTNSGEAAALAAQTLLTAERWDEALVAANTWRRREGGPSVGADTLASRARLGLGDASGALSTIEPHIDQALADPEANLPVIETYIRALVDSGQTQRARQTLEPMLKNSPRWQNLWVSVAANDIATPQTALDWLNTLDSRIGDDQSAQRMVQTHGYWTLAKRTSNSKALQLAEKHAQRLVDSPNATGQAWLLRGLIAEAQNNLPDAAQAYKQALQRSPNNPQVKNNLAMVLAEQETQLDRAVELAQQVVQARPNRPAYLDTLARAQAHAGQCQAALDTINKAANLDPGNGQWSQSRSEIEQICAQHNDSANAS